MPKNPSKRTGYEEAETRIAEALEKGMSMLFLNGLGLERLPESVAKLTQLEIIYIQDNRIAALPESIKKLSKLRALVLAGNPLVALPPVISDFPKLHYLDISSTGLTILPEWIGNLHGLSFLDLRGNRLSALPESLRNLERLQSLFLHENPALEIPDEALGPEQIGSAKPPKEILDYYFSTRGAKGVALRELRLIVVGSPKVGKTTLLRRLKRLPMNPSEPETHGIDIIPLDLHCKDGAMRARVWDFGGQHVLHAMHEFFLRRRCLYLLVVEQRTNMVERELTYWLQLIRSYAGDAPVVIALNQSQGIARPLARSALERDYPPILTWVPTECSKGYEQTIENLRKALTEAADQMAEPRKLFPRKWVEMKGWLEKMTEPYLEYKVFAERCAELGETNAEQQEALAALMDEMGIALNFARDPRLHDTTVLRPNWLANGIYTVLRANIITPRVLVPDGVLTVEKVGTIIEAAQAAQIIKPREYPSEIWEYLLRLMNLFQLSFPLDAECKKFLAPLLLPADEPPDCNEPEGQGRVRLRLNLSLSPAPLLAGCWCAFFRF
jgi:internalin A